MGVLVSAVLVGRGGVSWGCRVLVCFLAVFIFWLVGLWWVAALGGGFCWRGIRRLSAGCCVFDMRLHYRGREVWCGVLSLSGACRGDAATHGVGVVGWCVSVSVGGFRSGALVLGSASGASVAA